MLTQKLQNLLLLFMEGWVAIIYNRLIRNFDVLLRPFRKSENMPEIKQVSCIAVYVKLSQGVESFLKKIRHFDPLAELDLVDGVLMVFCATDELNALITSSIQDAKKKFDCASSVGVLTLSFNEARELQSPPMGMAVNAAILEASRLQGMRHSA
ncbi:hypothetical protein [Undibacterium sp. Tian12W]|uniref:hypothetical protein n=1 Tax=Undibacterium sp. Tian12W TaxID=3413054 RepID=UPI003BF2270C